MAGTLQLPNTSKTNIKVVDFLYSRDSKDTCYQYEHKIGGLTPSVCLQEDVLYPNAMGALADPLAQVGDQYAVGCRGHQIGRKFPFEPVLPVAIPLVQYPSPTRSIFPEQHDMCARPVLNWEDYITQCDRSVGKSLTAVLGVAGRFVSYILHIKS